MNKALMISIKPQHAINILNGKKTLELRSWIPKGYKGWVYVYVSKANKNNGGYLLKKLYLDGEFEKYITSLSLDEDLAPFSILNKKVLFRFWFDEHIFLKYGRWVNHKVGDWNYRGYMDEHLNTFDDLCLREQEVVNYGDGKNLYAWHIKKLEVFNKPKELKDFASASIYKKKINKMSLQEKNNVIFGNYLKKAPQKMVWVYVNE